MLSNLPQYYAAAALPKKQKFFVRCIPKNSFLKISRIKQKTSRRLYADGQYG